MRSRLRSQYHSIPGCVFFPGFLLAFVRKWKRHFVNYMYWTSETWYSIFWLRHACMLTCGVYAKGNNVLIKQEVKIFFLCLQSGWVNWVLLSRQENKQGQLPSLLLVSVLPRLLLVPVSFWNILNHYRQYWQDARCLVSTFASISTMEELGITRVEIKWKLKFNSIWHLGLLLLLQQKFCKIFQLTWKGWSCFSTWLSSIFHCCQYKPGCSFLEGSIYFFGQSG